MNKGSERDESGKGRDGATDELRRILAALDKVPRDGSAWAALAEWGRSNGADDLVWNRGLLRGVVRLKAAAAVAAFALATRDDETEGTLEDVTLYEGFAEPGAKNPRSRVVALGDWDDEEGDGSPGRLAHLLEGIGVDCRRGADWAPCDECNRLIRWRRPGERGPRHYRWRGGYLICLDCLKAGK